MASSVTLLTVLLCAAAHALVVQRGVGAQPITTACSQMHRPAVSQLSMKISSKEAAKLKEAEEAAAEAREALERQMADVARAISPPPPPPPPLVKAKAAPPAAPSKPLFSKPAAPVSLFMPTCSQGSGGLKQRLTQSAARIGRQTRAPPPSSPAVKKPEIKAASPVAAPKPVAPPAPSFKLPELSLPTVTVPTAPTGSVVDAITGPGAIGLGAGVAVGLVPAAALIALRSFLVSGRDSRQ
eukprot:6173032-Pleurochrysis_carterae.AAC.5